MSDPDHSLDAFLGGRVTLRQPRRGFRSGIDAVLLAAAVDAAPGQSVLELGCGAGAASLCLAARVPGLVLSGLEIQPDYAALAVENAARNGVAMTVATGDLQHMPPKLAAQGFDHVMANPPYYLPGKRGAAQNPGRERALAAATPLEAWIDAATRRLNPGGWLTMIQKAPRLGDMISALDSRLGSVTIKPIAPRKGRAAELVILRARKGGRADLILANPLISHKGRRHVEDGPSYRAAVEAILRDGGKMPI